MFFKIGSIKNSAIFARKHLCWGLFLIKLQIWMSATFSKIDSNTGVFLVDIVKFLRIAFLYNASGGCFWQSYHDTVKSAGVPVLWFGASECFQFWSKTFTKRRTINSLLSRDKTISSLLELVGYVYSISEYVLEKTFNCFRFWWKTYTALLLIVTEGIHLTLPPHIFSVQVKSGACYITGQ